MNQILLGILIFFGICISVVTIFTCFYIIASYCYKEKNKRDISQYYNNYDIYDNYMNKITSESNPQKVSSKNKNNIYRYPGYIEI